MRNDGILTFKRVFGLKIGIWGEDVGRVEKPEG